MSGFARVIRPFIQQFLDLAGKLGQRLASGDEALALNLGGGALNDAPVLFEQEIEPGRAFHPDKAVFVQVPGRGLGTAGKIDRCQRKGADRRERQERDAVQLGCDAQPERW